MIDLVEKRLGYRFRNPGLLEKALTHSSAKIFDNTENYERFEFLGDAVIELVVREFLLKEYPDEREGELTRRKIGYVSGAALADCALQTGIDSIILVGTDLMHPDSGTGFLESILAGVIEAVIGAVYLEGGYEVARRVVYQAVISNRKSKNVSVEVDPKTQLQELTMSKLGLLPRYVIAAREGPDHAPLFRAEVYIDGVLSGSGSGSTKRKAHQAAALIALERLEKED